MHIKSLVKELKRCVYTDKSIMYLGRTMKDVIYIVRPVLGNRLVKVLIIPSEPILG